MVNYSSVTFAQPRYRMHSTMNYYIVHGQDCKSSSTASSESLIISTPAGENLRPLNISFRCSRSVTWIDEAMKNTYKAIIQGDAKRFLISNPYGCPVGINTGHCGNVRRFLGECKCKVLNRIFNESRTKYENTVIQQIINIIGNNKTNFNVRIAMFASGKLHGEQCLLIRLIDYFKNNSYSGTIHISLIDTEYTSAINTSHLVSHLQANEQFNWIQLLGNRRDFEQFVMEISLCLPPGIVIEGSIFGSSDDYIWKAQNVQECKHDLMIGADLDGTDGCMSRANIAARRTNLLAIALVKRQEESNVVPKVCFFNKDHEHCYKV